jgi:hypothetical protein
MFRSPAKEVTPESGALPPWESAELPEPKPFSIRNALRAIGPGVILLGAAIGSGEWLIGPALTARYGGMLLWVATISVLLQVCLNTEAARYTLYSGEPIFSGYMRCRPGSRFWSFLYIVADSTTLWPGLVANAATAVAAAWLTLVGVEQLGPAVVARLKDEEQLVRTCAYLILAICAGLVLFGGKVYNMLKASITFMVIWILGYLILVDLFMVGPAIWKQVALGFFSFGRVPAGVDWSLVAAFAAFAGAGGLANASTSNYIREQGWGMGGPVGAIPSAVGGRGITLSHIGMVFPITPENVRRFREWYKYVRFDQYAIWAGGCFFGIALPAMLALRFIPVNTTLSGWDGAAFQAAGIAREYGAIFWYLTLLCGFWVLFSSQLLTVDSVGRRWTDMIWTGTLGERLSADWPSRGSGLPMGLASVAFAALVAAGALRGGAILYAALLLYGVPLGVRAVARVARQVRESEIEARMLVPVTLLFVGSVGLGLLLTLLGQLTWGGMARLLVVGVFWLLGSLFVIARGMQTHNVYKVYYLVVGIYVTWCCIALQIAQPLQMIVIAANIGGFLLVLTAVHTWHVNRRFLPRELQAGPLKQATLWACAAWYLTATLLSLDKTLQSNGIANLGLVDLVSRVFGH